MAAKVLSKNINNQVPALFTIPVRHRGKTESVHKYKTPKMRMLCTRPIYPAPGLNLIIPQDLDVQDFMRQIGADCHEYADKFEDINAVFKMTSMEMKAAGVPTHQKKYILRCVEQLRRGLLTFEYLGRRTCLEPIKSRK